MKEKLSSEDLENISSVTLNHYESIAASFWQGTKDHDVSQNYAAFLAALPDKKGLRILDVGCGPGRDLQYFKALGHIPVGLDGAEVFCRMARTYSGCTVLHQDFLILDLPCGEFDGIFANASLLHVPSQEFVRVLKDLKNALKPGGILFSSNPRGNSEGWNGPRYGTFLEFEPYEMLLNEAGFTVLHHYYRPAGLPREEQPWLAVVSVAK